MKRLGLSIIIIIYIFLFNACNTQDEEPQNGNEFDSLTVSGITLEWRVDTLGFLNVKVSAPSTGWIAVGFDPSQGMLDANIIIGYVLVDTAYFRDDYGTGINSHEPDVNGGGQDNITDQAGTEVGGLTTLEFTIPLDSGDGRDRVLIEGSTYTVLLAYGEDNADDFDSYHKERTVTQIDI